MRIKVKKDYIRGNISQGTFLDNRLGFWGEVLSVNAKNNTCGVKSDTGVAYSSIAVASSEWVKAGKEYVTGARDLPSVGARVFVLCPTHTIAGAFVLCSGYSKGDDDEHALFAKNADELKTKNTRREKVTQGGWCESEDYITGNRSIASKGSKSDVVLEVNLADDGDDIKQGAKLTFWGNICNITKDGVNITLSDDASLTLSVKDASVTINGDSSTTISGTKTEKASDGITLGNDNGTLGGMISDLLGYLAGLQTVGSPANHTASPDFIAKINALKGKWEKVFLKDAKK